MDLLITTGLSGAHESSSPKTTRIRAELKIGPWWQPGFIDQIRHVKSLCACRVIRSPIGQGLETRPRTNPNGIFRPPAAERTHKSSALMVRTSPASLPRWN